MLQNIFYLRDNRVSKYYLQLSCILEFGGVSMGVEFGDLNINRGPAGAGALLLAEDGSLVYTLYAAIQFNSIGYYIIYL